MIRIEFKMVRTFLLSVCAISLAFVITLDSCADLIDNGDGTITQIRSDGTKLMWTQDTLLAGDSGIPENSMNWSEARLWAENLEFAGYSDWRLPRTPGTTTNGVTVEGELGDLYYSELANLNNLDTFKMSDTHSNVFWTETKHDESSVFIVNFGNFKRKYSHSFQQICSKEDNRQAWAVRDVVDVPVTESTGVKEIAEANEAAKDTGEVETTEVIEAAKVNEVAQAVDVAKTSESVDVAEANEATKDTAEVETTEVTETIGVTDTTEAQ